MGLPHFTSFLCCIGLELGAKAIAFTHLATSLGIMVYMSTFAEGVRPGVGSEEDAERLYSRWYYIAVAVAVTSVGHVMLALTLIVSLYKRYASGVRVWVWLMCVLWAGAVAFNVLSAAVSGLNETGSDIFLVFIECLLLYAYIMYCILVVHSYYLMLKSAETMITPPKVI